MSFDQQIKVPGSVHIPGAGSSGSSTPSLADIIAGTLGVALLLGSVTPPAAGTRCIYGTGTDLVRDVGGKHIWQVGGADALQISAVTGGAGHYLKQSAAGGVLSSGVIAAADLPTGIDPTKLGTGSVTSAILAYLDATSSIQTQLNGKESTITTLPPAKGGLGMDASASSGFAKFTAGSAAIGALVAGDIPSLAGSIITSGTVGAAYLGSGTANSSTYLRGDNTWGAAPADATKLPLAGGTMTGALILGAGSSLDFGTAAGTSPGAGRGYIYGSSGVVYYNSPTNGYHDLRIQEVSQAFIYVKGLVFPTAHTADSTIYQFYRDANGVAVGVPTGKQLSILVAGAQVGKFDSSGYVGNYHAIGAYGLEFTAQSFIHSAKYQIFYDSSTGLQFNVPTNSGARGYAFFGSGAAVPMLFLSETCRRSVHVGLSLAAAGTRTVDSAATTKSGLVTVIDSSTGACAIFYVSNGTPTKIGGDATIVAGAPGASQIGLELSSVTLRINNGYAGAKNIAYTSTLA